MYSIEFTCLNCNEKFCVHGNFIGQKDSVKCPNCEQEFPKENFDKLKESFNCLVEARKFDEQIKSLNGDQCVPYAFRIFE